MNLNISAILNNFKKKIRDIRPFLRTKTGSRLALLFIIVFILLFFAPLFHDFVGAAIVGCVGVVFVILMWRKNDPEHAIVPAVFFLVPMLLDMAIYHTLPVVSCFVVVILSEMLCATAKMFRFFDKIEDKLYTYLCAGVVCAVTVVLSVLFMVIVSVAWWILAIVAFLLLIALFFTVVFSTAAYTASDGRRQARRRYEAQNGSTPRSDPQKKYKNYRPKERDNKVYNLDDDDFIDIE
ncbi:MAG: hypothetical protein IJH32_01475 [Ruminococcus sp.]|nr:hypothetical protein [Ruminococcus sp.]